VQFHGPTNQGDKWKSTFTAIILLKSFLTEFLERSCKKHGKWVSTS
jgi:hypothetical protein